MAIRGLPGGANIALTDTAQAVDLSLFAGSRIVLVCSEQDIQLAFTLDAEVSTTLVTGAQVPSRAALVADPVGATVKVFRDVVPGASRLVVKTVTGTGTLRIKEV